MAPTKQIPSLTIKGGGAALTREKIIAEASSQFVCIADDSRKLMCSGFSITGWGHSDGEEPVARALVELGGNRISPRDCY